MVSVQLAPDVHAVPAALAQLQAFFHHAHHAPPAHHDKSIDH